MAELSTLSIGQLVAKEAALCEGKKRLERAIDELWFGYVAIGSQDGDEDEIWRHTRQLWLSARIERQNLEGRIAAVQAELKERDLSGV